MIVIKVLRPALPPPSPTFPQADNPGVTCAPLGRTRERGAGSGPLLPEFGGEAPAKSPNPPALHGRGGKRRPRTSPGKPSAGPGGAAPGSSLLRAPPGAGAASPPPKIRAVGAPQTLGARAPPPPEKEESRWGQEGRVGAASARARLGKGALETPGSRRGMGCARCPRRPAGGRRTLGREAGPGPKGPPRSPGLGFPGESADFAQGPSPLPARVPGRASQGPCPSPMALETLPGLLALRGGPKPGRTEGACKKAKRSLGRTPTMPSPRASPPEEGRRNPCPCPARMRAASRVWTCSLHDVARRRARRSTQPWAPGAGEGALVPGRGAGEVPALRATGVTRPGAPRCRRRCRRRAGATAGRGAQESSRGSWAGLGVSSGGRMHKCSRDTNATAGRSRARSPGKARDSPEARASQSSERRRTPLELVGTQVSAGAALKPPPCGKGLPNPGVLDPTQWDRRDLRTLRVSCPSVSRLKGPGVPGLPLPWGPLQDRNHFIRSKPSPQIHTVA